MSGIASTVYWKIDDQKLTNCLKITYYRSRIGFTHKRWSDWFWSHIRYRLNNHVGDITVGYLSSTWMLHQKYGPYYMAKRSWEVNLLTEIIIRQENMAIYTYQMHHILLNKLIFCVSECRIHYAAYSMRHSAACVAILSLNLWSISFKSSKAFG